MPNPTSLNDPDSLAQYRTLLSRWPLVEIKTTIDYEESMKTADELVRKGEAIQPGEIAYFEVLVMLIQDYENRRPALASAIDGPDVLAFLLEEHGLSQAEIALELGVAKQTINDYLKQRRGLPAEIRQALMRRFGLTKDLFEFSPVRAKKPPVEKIIRKARKAK